MSVHSILRKYLWRHSKSEWLRYMVTKLVRKSRLFVFIVIIFSMVLTTLGNDESTIAGSTDKYLIQQAIISINKSLPAVEAAFYDIEKLTNSVTKVAYTNPDQAFIYAFMICKWSKHYNLDPAEVAAVAMTESEFNYKAVSKKDARGLMQIHKPTWHMDNYFDAEENIKMGAKILSMYKRSNPSNYLEKYSGGEPGYAKKVKSNEKKMKGDKHGV